jgi:hypothetical protein
MEHDAAATEGDLMVSSPRFAQLDEQMPNPPIDMPDWIQDTRS